MLKSFVDALSYLRSALLTPLAALWTLIISVIVIFLASLRWVKTRDFVIARLWADPILFLNGIRTEVRGLERIQGLPNGFLVLFNHSSHMDIPVLFSGFPRLVKFGAKAELFKIPFFGKAMSLVGALPIERANRNKVMKVYEQAQARLKNGEIFALAPEGTRQPEPQIGKFKRGPFEFAVNAEAYIVPITLAGAFEVLPRTAIGINAGKWRRKVILEVADPVSTAGMGNDDLERLQSEVRARMESDFVRLHQELYGF